MATKVLDCKGLKCPTPTLKVTIEATKLKPGDVLECVADCPSFEDDVREWVKRMNKVLLWVKQEGDAKRVQIQM